MTDVPAVGDTAGPLERYTTALNAAIDTIAPLAERGEEDARRASGIFGSPDLAAEQRDFAALAGAIEQFDGAVKQIAFPPDVSADVATLTSANAELTSFLHEAASSNNVPDAKTFARLVAAWETAADRLHERLIV